MKNAPDRKAAESAVEQRHFTAAAAPRRVDLQQAVRDIREAAADIARASERIASSTREARQ
jgi:hypothetical protein